MSEILKALKKADAELKRGLWNEPRETAFAMAKLCAVVGIVNVLTISVAGTLSPFVGMEAWLAWPAVGAFGASLVWWLIGVCSRPKEKPEEK